MGNIQRWSGVSGNISIECDLSDDGEWIDAHSEKPLPKLTADELIVIFGGFPDDAIELVINFTSDGYYDPGRTYGDPFYCYPPEGDDERTIDGQVEIWENGKRTRKTLSKEASADLFETYREKIEDQELDHSEPDYD